MDNAHPYGKRKKPKSKNKSVSQKQEKVIAERVGGRVQPGSGSPRNPLKKGDVSTPFMLLEAKWTRKKTYKLSIEELAKIQRESRGVGKIPIFVVGFDEDVGVSVDKQYCVIPFRYFEELLDVIESSGNK